MKRAPGWYRYWLARRRFRNSWNGRALTSHFEYLLCGDGAYRAERQAVRLARLHPRYKRAQRRAAKSGVS